MYIKEKRSFTVEVEGGSFGSMFHEHSGLILYHTFTHVYLSALRPPLFHPPLCDSSGDGV